MVKTFHLTKCWKVYLRTAWFAFGILSSNFFISSSLMCRSGIIEICSKSAICSWGSKGGSRLKKKSLTAVATLLTAMSKLCMSKFWSSSKFWKMRSTWALLPGTQYIPSVKRTSNSMNSIQRDRKTGIVLSSLALQQIDWKNCSNIQSKLWQLMEIRLWNVFLKVLGFIYKNASQ